MKNNCKPAMMFTLGKSTRVDHMPRTKNRSTSLPKKGVNNQKRTDDIDWHRIALINDTGEYA